ncbi:hypothetical protein PENTCL1PPCAC_12693, partial [Pristionchus entomophagus]
EMDRTMLFLIALTIPCTSAIAGIDTIASITPSGFQCLRENGWIFYIGRVGKSNGAIDQTGVQNIKNAWAGGLSSVDAYLFPCHSSSCGSAKQQVADTVHGLWNAGAEFGRLWLDVEIYNWGPDLNENRQFLLDMVEQCEDLGVSVGIYSNNNNWQNIVGISWDGVSSYPLWWANYNGQNNFNNFKPFGGWSQPAIHQYQGDVKGSCSVGNVDLNWYP